MKSLKLALALTLASAGTAQVAQAGPIWGANGHEYELVDARTISWSGANTAANTAGWYLATVTSAAENAFIINSVLSVFGSLQDRAHYWIGGTDSQVEGTWAWGTGEAFSFQTWWGGEPNNAGNEDYLAYDYRNGWGWNDAIDNLNAQFPGFPRGYIMERAVGVPEPTTLGMLGLGLLAAAGVARRRRKA